MTQNKLLFPGDGMCTLLEQKCQHVIPCAISKEMRQFTVTQLEEARRSGDDYRVLIYITQLTGPCTTGSDNGH